MALTLHYIARGPALEHLNRIISLKEREYHSVYAMICLGSLSVLLITLIVNYYSFTGKNDPAWTTRITNKCESKYLDKAFEKHYLMDSG